MNITQVLELIEKRSLLKHPFYQAWQEGKISKELLRDYAAQYYHFTEHFPRFVAYAYAQCHDPKMREQILQNLIEEEIGDYHKYEPHAHLWLDFCEALGLSREEVRATPLSAATRELLSVFEREARKGFAQAVAVVLSYEQQVSEIARTKKEGLLAHYDLKDDKGTYFFTLHHAIDIEHSRLWRDILERFEDGVNSSLQAGLEAQWAFLDQFNIGQA